MGQHARGAICACKYSLPKWNIQYQIPSGANGKFDHSRVCILMPCQVFDWPAETTTRRPDVWPTTVMIQGNLDPFRRAYYRIFDELIERISGKCTLCCVSINKAHEQTTLRNGDTATVERTSRLSQYREANLSGYSSWVNRSQRATSRFQWSSHRWLVCIRSSSIRTTIGSYHQL